VAARAATVETPQRGGTLRYVTSNDTPTLDPAKGITTSFSPGYLEYAFSIYGALVYIDQESGEIQLGMAQSLRSIDGGTTWLLRVRPGIKFTDGTPYDAAAVDVNWRRMADPANASPNLAAFNRIATFGPVDKLTMKVVLTNRNATFPFTLAGNFAFIASPKALKENLSDINQHPIGAGPFMVQSRINNVQTVLVRNPTYWDKPRPYVDKIIQRNIIDPTARTNTFQAGEADLMVTNNAADYTYAKVNKLPRNRILQKGSIGVGFNPLVKGLDDLRIRQALAMTVNRTQIAEKALNLPGTESYGLFQPNQKWYNPAAKFPAYDLEKAKSLVQSYLDERGLKGLTFRWLFTAGVAAQEAQGTLFKAQWEKIPGINIELVPASVAQQTLANSTKTFQLSSYAVYGSAPEFFFYNTFATTGSTNGLSYSNPTVDSLLDITRNSTDPQVVLKAYKDLQIPLVKDLPFLPTRAISFEQEVKNPLVRGYKAFHDAGLRSDLVWLKRK
jgi:peptide/nickel transport system substrate-binding protein